MYIIETIEFDACKIRRLKQALIFGTARTKQAPVPFLSVLGLPSRDFKILTTDYENAQTLRNTMDDSMQIISFQTFVYNTTLWCFYMLLFSLVFTIDINISKITKDKFSSEVCEDKAERIFF